MISATILTKNSARTLDKALQSLTWVDEIIIFDTGSTDSTLEIAQQFSNTSIHEGALEGFGKAHNDMATLAKHEWILSIDSDEIVSEELRETLERLSLDKDYVYSFSRHNYYNDKHITCCSWHPERVLRLYNKTRTHFSSDLVHEKILKEGLCEIKLLAPLQHTPYLTTADFLQKMQHYSTLFAEQRKGTCSLLTAITHGLGAFLKNYILKRGFLGGCEGFIISVYNANTAFYKYLKLWEKGRNKNAPSHQGSDQSEI